MDERKTCHCIKIRRAANAITQLYDLALSDLKITTAQFSLLYSLEKIQPCSMRQLADYMDLERSTLVRNMKILTDRQLVIDAREAGMRDSSLSLSGKGNSLLKEAIPKWNGIQKKLEDKIGAEEIKGLESLLDQIIKFN